MAKSKGEGLVAYGVPVDFWHSFHGREYSPSPMERENILAASSASVSPDAPGATRMEQPQPTREHMRLCCGVVQLLCDRTGCTLAEAAQCLEESADQIADWQRVLQEHNDPQPGLAEINNFLPLFAVCSAA